VPLIWNAPGDDGHSGQADHYDIRFSLSEIDEANWDDATPVDDPPVPKAAPGLETLVVKGLGSNKTYYFALKSWDDAGNVSDLSNNASATTLPEIQPPAGIDDLVAEALTLNEYLLTWTAPGDDGTLPGRASRYDVRYSTAPITGGNWADAQRADNEPDPAPSGEPDSFLCYIPDPEPDKSYYFAMKTADEVPNWSVLSNVVMAMAAGQNILAFPVNVYPGQTPAVEILFRSVNQNYLYKLSVTRFDWHINQPAVIKHFAPERYPAGVHSRSWDLRDDDGELVSAYWGQLWIRLYHGPTPVDSTFVRLF
jgi:hypothetical protein